MAIAGGGILNGASSGGSASLTVTNSTISGNLAAVSADGFGGNGGGIVNFPFATVTVTNSTISGNSASVSSLGGGSGGGIYSYNDGTLNLNTSIVGNNFAVAVPDISGIVSSGDYNLVENTSGATLSGTHNITGVDPMLGPLQDNGGPTFTHELLTGSPAIDMGDPNFTSATRLRSARSGLPACGKRSH